MRRWSEGGEGTGLGPREAEAQVDDAGRGPVPEAVDDPRESRVRVPGAAPNDPVGTTRTLGPRGSIGRCPQVAVVPVVFDPLEDVSQDIVQAPDVRELATDSVGRIAGVT